MSRALKLIRQGRPGKRSPQLTPGPSTITPGGSLVAVLMVVVAFGARRQRRRCGEGVARKERFGPSPIAR